MNMYVKVGIGVGIGVVVIGGIYLLSRPSTTVLPDGSGTGVVPDNQAGNPTAIDGRTDTQVIAQGIANVLSEGIRSGFHSLDVYNTTVAAQNARREQQAAAMGGAAQDAARQLKLRGMQA